MLVGLKIFRLVTNALQTNLMCPYFTTERKRPREIILSKQSLLLLSPSLQTRRKTVEVFDLRCFLFVFLIICDFVTVLIPLKPVSNSFHITQRLDFNIIIIERKRTREMRRAFEWLSQDVLYFSENILFCLFSKKSNHYRETVQE